MNFQFEFPYKTAPAFSKKVAYFCMEFGIHQPLKTYAGGLGFLAGSHMRSAKELQQHMVGIGILWKYGYYDQVRKPDQTMDVLFQEKLYGFLVETGIRISIKINGHNVFATALYLPPGIFDTAPVFFLTTDLPENDYLAKTICHKLYDSNPEAKIAAAILLGEGGARILDAIGWIPDRYHLNESHALPLAFYLYRQYGNKEEVRKRLVFTNHTPEPGGNEETDLALLDKLGFFSGVPINEVRHICGTERSVLDHTLTALRLSGAANGVSKTHCETLEKKWKSYPGICQLKSITNAQNFSYWHDPGLYNALEQNDGAGLIARKQQGKQVLFEEVADQTGEVYQTDILTLVFAKRFGGYKRPELLLADLERFHALVTNASHPIQVIWAGKPYPMDYNSIALFDKIVHLCRQYTNCSILAGYEMKLSKQLKLGADIWLNTPRITHEASGTSGMSAAMNGAINASIPDGWFPEYAKDGINSFIIPAADPALPDYEQDKLDADSLYDLLQETIIPLYYHDQKRWLSIMKNSMKDIVPRFDSNRMAIEYYEQLYTATV